MDGNESFHINLEVGGEWEMEAWLEEIEERSVIERVLSDYLYMGFQEPPPTPPKKSRTLKTATAIPAETLKTVQIRSGLFLKAEVICSSLRVRDHILQPYKTCGMSALYLVLTIWNDSVISNDGLTH